MKGMIAIVGWEDLFESPWFKSSARLMGQYNPDGKWVTPPRRGVYAVDVMQDVMWGPFDTETEAVGYVVGMITQVGKACNDNAGRVLH